MCIHCNITGNKKQNVVLVDPTKTLTLRQNFIVDLNRRFTRLQRAITKAIVSNDVFGLNKRKGIFNQELTTPTTRAYAFERDKDKINSFMGWLKEQEDKDILEVVVNPRLGQGIEEPWTNTYISSAYKKGIVRGKQELNKIGVKVEKQSKFSSDPFDMPIHADRAGVLYTRTFSELKGITASMDTKISRILSQGIMDGKAPRQLAKQINEVLGGEALTRARTIARTEIIRAHHLANIQEYRNAGIEGVEVQAEWKTAGDSHVCEKCAAMNGKKFTLDEIEPLIPLHPNCRCIALPVIDTEDEDTKPSPIPVEEEEAQPITEELVDGKTFVDEIYQKDSFVVEKRASIKELERQLVKDEALFDEAGKTSRHLYFEGRGSKEQEEAEATFKELMLKVRRTRTAIKEVEASIGQRAGELIKEQMQKGREDFTGSFVYENEFLKKGANKTTKAKGKEIDGWLDDLLPNFHASSDLGQNNPTFTIAKMKSNYRASFSPAGMEMSLSSGEDTTAETVFHETGHLLDTLWSVPKKNAFMSWFKKRTNNFEKIVNVGAKGEYGFDGGFLHSYTGKLYGYVKENDEWGFSFDARTIKRALEKGTFKLRSHEVSSMALQTLSKPEALFTLLEKDPDHFSVLWNFVLTNQWSTL